jgi:hypothetical protein
MTTRARSAPSDSNQLILAAFARLHQTALGVAVGTVSGLVLFVATLWLVLKGGPVVGPTLSLLNQYFPGYAVTGTGAFLGLLYGFVLGFLIGWMIAFVRNILLNLYLRQVKREAELEEASRLLDRW